MSERAKKNIFIILIIVFAGVFAVSAYMLISYFLETGKAEAEFDEIRKELKELTEALEPEKQKDQYKDIQPAYLALKAENKDLVGWLRIYDTAINYPVMQTISNPEYYLHRSFSREYSGSGTLFASEISEIEQPSDVIIVYGHRMKNGSMFGSFNKFTKPEYLKEHRYIRFDTLSERRTYEIFCVLRTTVETGQANEFKYYNAASFQNEDEFNSYIKEAQSKAYFETGITPAYGDELIVLSTCEYSEENSRLVIMGKRVEDVSF
jgi:sortase B